MSKLIKVELRDIPIEQNGLSEATFEKQLNEVKFPGIYVDISGSTIIGFSINSGILTIQDSETVNRTFDVWSKSLIELCELIEAEVAGSSAKLVSETIGLLNCLFLHGFSSRNIFNIEIDKSPILLSDFHPDTLSNIVAITDTNPTYSVIDVVDGDDPVSFNLTSKNNLFVDKLGTAIIDYRLNKFLLLISTDHLVTTKYLLNHALNTEIIKPEKNLLLNQFLQSFNAFYG